MLKHTILKNKTLAGLVGLLIIYCLIPQFVHSPYYLDLLIILLMNAVLSMTFVLILRTGLITMAISAFWGFGGYTSAVLVMKWNLSFWLALPAAAIITALVAWILGFFLIKNTGFTFVIITSCIGMAFPVVAGNLKITNGYAGLSNIPSPNTINIPFVTQIVFDSKVQYLYLLVLLSVISILIILAFYSASTGRAWTAIGMNSRLASSLGIDVLKYRQSAFVVASFIAGIYGSYFTHYQGFISPGSFGIFNTIYMQVYAILGGLSYAIAGPLLGSAIMTFFPEVMRVVKTLGPIFTGTLLVLLVMFLPQGLLSLGQRPAFRDWITEKGKGLTSFAASRRKAKGS